MPMPPQFAQNAAKKKGVKKGENPFAKKGENPFAKKGKPTSKMKKSLQSAAARRFQKSDKKG